MATLTIRPNGDSAAGFGTAAPSANHWENVDEAVLSEVDYNLTTGTEEDIYTFENHTTESGTITSVVVYARILHSYTEDKIKLKVNSTYSGYLDEGGGYQDYSFNPGGSWTWTDIDNITAGIRGEVATGDIRIAQIYITITYNPGTDPTVTTTSVANPYKNSASGGGNCTNDGGSSVTARGVCWKTLSGPTTSDSKTTDGTGTGEFSSSITGLVPNTTYYVRAYATNSTGTGYGSEVSFRTSGGLLW